MNERFDHADEIRDYVPLMLDNCSVYQFGVCTGSTLKRALNIIYDMKKPVKKVYGFDSWLGLPNTIDKEWFAHDWYPGSFSALREYKVNSVEELMPKLKEYIGYDVEFVSGWFIDTLNDENYEKFEMSQASYIDIDVDIHSSTKQVLDFCVQHKIIDVGTIIRYDDWLSGQGLVGNRKAHIEMLQEYDIIFESLSWNMFKCTHNNSKVKK